MAIYHIVMRTIVSIPEQSVNDLDRLGQAENRSRASLIREAIAEYVARRGQAQTAEAFGVWKQRAVDGVAYQEELRGEWDSR